MSLKRLMAGLALCLSFHTLFAANDRFEGVVKDDSGNPVEFANVTLMAMKDSTLIDGTVTDSDGKFILTGSSVPVFIRVSALGFNDKFVDNPPMSVGEIVMTPAEYMLDEVVVKGTRPVAKLKSDGVQVAITGTYLANTGTALDLLGKMPFVTKSGSEIEILGKGAPLIYVNGRQLRDHSELDQLSSAQIKSVDVVTNPGARYDSTVNSVIRITTITPVGEGFSFNDRTTVGYKHYVYLFEQANFNYREKGFDLFGMLNYENYRERPSYDNSKTQYLQSGVVTQNSIGGDVAKYPVYQGRIGLNYSLDSHNLGFYYDFSFRPSTSSGSSSTSRFVDHAFSESLDKVSDTSGHKRQHLFSAYYAGNVGKWMLSANFDALWQINDESSDEHEASSANPQRDFSTLNDVDNRMIAANVIASFQMWKGNFRFGAEVSNIHRTDIYSGNADYITDNDIKINETTTAMFAETEQSFGEISANVGLRWEITESKYYQFGIKQDDQSREYRNLAPSASLSFPVGQVRANLSYTRKTTRPYFEQLNSAVRYLDRYSYESGNPGLKPIYRDYLSASVSWKDLVIELEYTSTRNYFMWQTSPYPGNDGVTLLLMENMPRFNSYGAYINYSPTFFGCWHPSIMAGIDAQDFKITHHDETLHLDNPIGMFRFNNAIHLPWDFWLDIDFSARTSGNGENLYLKSTWNCDLGIYKSFANDTWSLKLQLNDVFDTWRQEFIMYDALSRATTTKIFDTRDLSLTIRYNFNSAKSRYKGQGAGNADKDRM